MFKSSHRPDGKMADMPKSTLIFRVGLIFGSIRDMYVPATPANFPSPPWETHVLLVFTGRRCLCLFRHRHNDVLLDHRQHSFWIGACSCSKLRIAPMGKMLTRLLRLSLCTTGNASVNYSMYVPQRPSKVPIAPMGDSCFACFYRAAVSMSTPAPSQ